MKKSTPAIVTNGGISTSAISADLSHPKIQDNKYITANSEDTNTATLKSTKNMNNT